MRNTGIEAANSGSDISREITTLTGHGGYVMSLTSLGEEQLASGSGDQTIKIWNWRAGKCERTLTGHEGSVMSLTSLGEAKLASGSGDQTIKIWQVAGTKEKSELAGADNRAAIDTSDHIGASAALPNLGGDVSELAHQKADSKQSIGSKASELPVASDMLSSQQKSNSKEALSSSDKSGSSSVFTMLPMIQAGEMTLGDILGEGGFGVVHKGRWQKVTVAIKRLRAKTLTEATLNAFREESRLHGQLRHPNVVSLYGACLEPGHFSMVMEYMSGGSLYQLLHSSKELLWSLRKSIASDIAVGLNYLHESGIIHRDLKSLNVLLDGNDQAKLADFGLSGIKTETASTMTVTTSTPGTVRWMAPELFKRMGKCNRSTDIYAMGCVFWELSSRKLPFQDSDGANDMTIPMWVKDGERDDIPSDCPVGYAALIRKCWAQNPEDRPMTAELVADEVEGLDVRPGYAYYSK